MIGELIRKMIDLYNSGYVYAVMECPACKTEIEDGWRWIYTKSNSEQYMNLFITLCPSCSSHLVGYSISDQYVDHEIVKKYEKDKEGIEFLWPATTAPILDSEIPEEWRKLYSEAYIIQDLSPRASVVLGRACLELLLRKYSGIKGKNLYEMIDEIIKAGVLNSEPISSRIQRILNLIRKLGNKAVHVEDTSDGELRKVDPIISKNILELLPQLFEHLVLTPKKQDQLAEELEKFVKKSKNKSKSD